ncbi:MAG: heavy-metal-associated domain-containing protein [Alphaproteobacteria bacterium]
MKRFLIVVAGMLVLGSAGILSATHFSPPAAQSAATRLAAARTATFAVENMTCALCPVTVRKAMEGVTGVKSVAIDFDAKTATVVFDPSVTDIGTIAAASTNAGYPARAKS